MSITYREYLINNYRIDLNNKQVNSWDPFVFDIKYEEIKSRVISKYNISLQDIFQELNDKIIQEEIHSNFKDIFKTQKDMLNEKINITLYALSSKFTNQKQKISRTYKELSEYIFPNIDDSGFYIKRNKRYI